MKYVKYILAFFLGTVLPVFAMKIDIVLGNYPRHLLVYVNFIAIISFITFVVCFVILKKRLYWILPFCAGVLLGDLGAIGLVFDQFRFF